LNNGSTSIDTGTIEPDTNEAAYRLAAIVTNSDDAIVSKDLNGIVMSWNPGAERLFGFTSEEMIGQSIRKIIPDDLQSEEDHVLSLLRRGERVDHFETVRQRKDGSKVPISLTVSPVKDGSGRIIGASKIARDISDKKAAEEAIQRSMALKDQFLGLVSHELRTPLSTIVANGQVLLHRGDRISEEDRLQALRDVVDEGERLHQIVENLLLLTRLESGHIQAQAVDLPVLIGRVVESHRRRRPLREVRVTEPEATSPKAAADPVLLRLVLDNLITNADKYSPIELPIDVVLSQDTSGRPVIRVMDHGDGVDPDDVERVFEPFYRSEATRLTVTGMGLGLAVCKRVVEALDGSIAYEARPDGGPTFCVTIPAASEPS
jgi:PAS domain S-box-containing protein